jgi:hypothetical protein
MQIEYKRHNMDNYMCINLDRSAYTKENAFEYRMIEENNIKGLLSCVIVEESDKIGLNYKISSKQRLGVLLEQKTWDIEELILFLDGFLRALQGIEEFMLDTDKLYINKECIFVDMDTLDTFLCYIPSLNTDVKKDISDLIFDIADNIRTRDDELLSKLHALYKISKEKEFDIERLKKFIAEFSTSNSGGGIEREVRKTGDYTVQKAETDFNDEEEDEETQKDESGIAFSIKSIFAKKKKIKEEKKQEDRAWESFFDEDEKEGKDEQRTDKRGLGRERDYERTVLLSESVSAKFPRLRCLSEPEFNIDIKYFPFVVGRQERLCDFCIDKEGVSRLHFKLEKIDNNYVIADLNSRNGIKVKGKLLDNEEYCVIKSGDKVEVADLEYIFE